MSMSKSRERTDWMAFLATLSPEERELVGQADALMAPVEKNNSEGLFVEGDALLLVKQHAQKRTFSMWCRHKGFDRSASYKRMKVVENLGPFRHRLIAARVQPGALLVLGRFPDRVDEILRSYETGERPTLDEVEEYLGVRKKDTASNADVEVGGDKGVMRLYDSKRRHIPEFIAVLEKIIAAIDDALGADRLVKTHLAKKVVSDARWANRVLLHLGTFIEPLDLTYGKIRPVPFPVESRWHQVEKVLFTMGGAEDVWPPANALGTWLVSEVRPLLNWAARGEGDPKVQTEEAIALPADAARSAWPTGPEAQADSSYLLPEQFAFDDEDYEVAVEHAPGWHEASLNDGVWRSSAGAIRPILIKLHQRDIELGLRLLSEQCPPDVPVDGQEEWRNIHARSVSALLIYGESFDFGKAPAVEPVIRIATALIRELDARR
ncbi:hypothetical protein [Tianweitania sediminis]|uniref:Uncharacterized protein n=1 Tax=Tianweitania sediminis TaxID=1502156 RepID=A0A8J7R3M6_9HYPH|nr:hypothetical protein [Tianweitania sediminis]MBP0439951.1 hypothetical protein [Tianweitania sediminis]